MESPTRQHKKSPLQEPRASARAASRTPSPIGLYPIGAGLFALLGAFLVWPIISVLDAGFRDGEKFTTYFLRQAVTDPLYLDGLINSLKIATATTLFCMIVATGLAILSVHTIFPAKRIFTALLLLPMILPPFVGAIGFKKLFAPFGGPVNILLQRIGILDPNQYVDLLGVSPFWSVVVLEMLHLYPIMFLNVEAALSNIDPAMSQAARNLGAGTIRTFFKITFPLMRPGLFAGATIVFIWSFTELGTPLMLEYRNVTAVQIYEGLAEIQLNPQPYALVLVLLIATILLYLIGKVLLGKSVEVHAAKAVVAPSPRRLGPITAALAALAFASVTAMAVLPHVGVVLVAIEEQWSGTILPTAYTSANLTAAISHDLARPSIINSLRYSSLSMALDLIIGTAIAWILVRTALPGRRLLDALAMLPLAVPGLVIAFGYLSLAQPGRPLDMFNPADDPTVLLVIAYAVRRLPFVVRSAAAGLEQSPTTYEEAAADLGAPRWTVLRRITLPLIAANLIAGALLAFSFAMLEVSDSLILAAERPGYPITKAIYALSKNMGVGIPLSSGLGVWGMLLLAATLIAASLLLGKKLGALFRL
jgi:iron(III) transport system permease protein